jgi:hypothetical protein
MKCIIISALLALFMVLYVSQSHAGWLIYHKPEFHGRVIDVDTKEPIEGAVVVIAYYKNAVGSACRHSSIINVRKTVTDHNGEFYLPSYTTLIQPFSIGSRANFIIYKPGYGSFPGFEIPRGILPGNEEIFFSKKTGSTGELDFWEFGGKQPELKVSKVVFGIVGLPKLKTKEDKRKAAKIGCPDQKRRLLKKALKDDDEKLKNVAPESNPTGPTLKTALRMSH